MKEFISVYHVEIDNHLLINTLNLVSLNCWIGRNMMCGALDYAHPTDLLRIEFDEVYGSELSVTQG